MPNVKKELLKAGDVDDQKKGESRQDFCLRVMKATHELSDAKWEALSQDAKDWFNEACDLKAENKKGPWDFAVMSGEEPDEEEKPTTRRRGSSDDAPAVTTIQPTAVKVKMMVKITNKRGKDFTGTVVEADDEVIVVKLGNGDEEEIGVDRIESIEVLNLDKGKGKSDEPEADVVKVGTVVKLVTKRDKEVTGKIVELDDEIVVIDVDGQDQEFAVDRVKSMTPVAAEGKAEGKAEGGRRGKTEEANEEPAKDGKAKRASNEGVSIGQRIKELIAENLDADEAEIAKLLKKEGLDFKDNTLKLNFVDCHKFLTILKAKKLLK